MLEENKQLNHQESLGYINPLWTITFTHEGKTLTQIPLFFLCSIYLKDYGFEPEKKTNPPICVEIDIGGSVCKFPLTTKHPVEFGKTYTTQECVDYGLLYKIKT